MMNNKFYADKPTNFLRLGDVISGFACLEIVQDDLHSNEMSLKISDKRNLLVIVTPCCSIENRIITVTELKQIKSTYFKNEHFIDNLTLINKPIYPQEMLARDEWEKLSDVEKKKRGKEKSYTEYNIFIYDVSDSLPEYKSRHLQTRYYMIDFTKQFSINSQIIKRNLNPEDLVKIKKLELSKFAREDLRLKLAYYYSRRPSEDDI